MELKQKHHAQQKAAAGKPNLTGIPLQMKQSFERSSGLSFDDVRVHYHSSLPARLGALAYTRGSHVYVSSGQERHLGHELGHVIQQKQGQVRATSELNGVRLNTSPVMEREADALSRQAARGEAIQRCQGPSSQVVQMATYANISAMWQGLCGNPNVETMIQQILAQDPVLNELYQDADQQVSKCDFRESKDPDTAKKIAHIQLNPSSPPLFIIHHTPYSDIKIEWQRVRFIRAIIHELTHAAAGKQYHRNVSGPILNNGLRLTQDTWLNMNLPPASAPPPARSTISDNQMQSFNDQNKQLKANINHLRSVVNNDTVIVNTPSVHNTLIRRLQYIEETGYHHHYDSVLGDMMFYLQFKDLQNMPKMQNTPSYKLMQRMLREANDRRHQRRWFGNNEMPYDFSTASSWFSRY